MKIKDAIKYLSDYEDQEQEILIAWNDKEFIEDETITDEVWDKAVWLFDKYCGESFNDECRAVISQAEYDLREEKESA